MRKTRSSDETFLYPTSFNSTHSSRPTPPKVFPVPRYLPKDSSTRHYSRNLLFVLRPSVLPLFTPDRTSTRTPFSPPLFYLLKDLWTPVTKPTPSPMDLHLSLCSDPSTRPRAGTSRSLRSDPSNINNVPPHPPVSSEHSSFHRGCFPEFPILVSWSLCPTLNYSK